MAGLDLRERVVDEDDHRDAQPEARGGLELGHGHGEASVADDAGDLTVGVRELQAEGRGEAVAHR